MSRQAVSSSRSWTSAASASTSRPCSSIRAASAGATSASTVVSSAGSRNPRTNRTGVAPRSSTRYRSSCRAAGSAQCRSSSTRISGAIAAARSMTSNTALNIRWRAVSSSPAGTERRDSPCDMRDQPQQVAAAGGGVGHEDVARERVNHPPDDALKWVVRHDDVLVTAPVEHVPPRRLACERGQQRGLADPRPTGHQRRSAHPTWRACSAASASSVSSLRRPTPVGTAPSTS